MTLTPIESILSIAAFSLFMGALIGLFAFMMNYAIKAGIKKVTNKTKINGQERIL